jgi:UPF0755 protein
MSERDERSTQRPRPPRREVGQTPPPQKRRRRRGMSPWSALLYVVLVIGASALLAGLGWIAACDVLSLDKPEKTAVVTLPEDIFDSKEVKDGDGGTKTVLYADLGYVADQLKEQEVIRYPWLFKLFVSFTGKADDLRPGIYNLDTTMDYSAIVRNLSAKSGSKAEVTVVIKEGYTSAQIFQALADASVASVDDLEKTAASYDFKFSFLKDVVPLGEKNRLEGYLFPDTYQFYTGMDSVQALNKMLLRFDEVFTQDMRDQVASNGQTVRDVVTIASLIEKETTGDDQTLISSVIYNRLYKSNSQTAGYLNIDASLLYVLPERAGKLTAADLEYDSPYNTKKYQGLPPGPIANPGQAALRAALKPESSSYYFYALGDDKEHHFFKTYEEQTAFIAKQEIYKNNGG